METPTSTGRWWSNPAHTGSVCIGQCGSCYAAAKPHVVNLAADRLEAGLDVAQTLAISQLGKGHGQVLIPAGKVFCVAVATVANHTFLEFLVGQMLDQLRKDGSASVHFALLLCPTATFEAKHAELIGLVAEGADPEDPDEYRAENIFWVPKEGRWSVLKDNTPQPTIGKLVDDAMAAIGRDNPSLQGVLPKDYSRPGLDKQRLGQLINLVSDIAFGSPADRSKDMLGRVYEYFLSQFASAEGKKGVQFYTPSHVVRVLVEMLAPYKGRVYDPRCGSGRMFV